MGREYGQWCSSNCQLSVLKKVSNYIILLIFFLYVKCVRQLCYLLERYYIGTATVYHVPKRNRSGMINGGELLITTKAV